MSRSENSIPKPFDVIAYRRERSINSRGKIEAFVMKHHLEKREFSDQNKKLLLLDAVGGGGGVKQDMASAFIAQHILEDNKGIINNCFTIARDMVVAGMCSGVLRSDEDDHTGSGTSDFVGWGNHGVGYKTLPDGSVIAVDLTASHNVDYRLGNLDVLVIRAASFEKLLEMLNELFGGNWAIPRNRKY